MFQTPKSLRAFLIAGIVCSNLFVIVLLAGELIEDKGRREAEAAETVENISKLLDQNIGDLANKIDLSLRNIADGLQREIAYRGRLDSASVNRLLSDRRDWLAGDADFRITDATGIVKYGPGVSTGTQATYADRGFFKTLQDNPNSGLIVTNPVLGKVSKIWVVVFSRRYVDQNGRFQGVVAAAVPISRLQQLIATPDLGPHGVASLRDADNALITRNPPISGPAGQLGSKVFSATFGKIVDSGVKTKTYHTALAGEGVERTIGYRRMAAVPFHLVVGVGAEDYLAEWRKDIRSYAALEAVFLAVTVAFAWILWHLFIAMDRAGQHSRVLLQHASDGIHILNKRGEIIQASESFCKMLEYSSSEVVGMEVCQWDSQLSETEIADFLSGLFQEKITKTFETRHRTKSGKLIDVEISAYSLELGGQQVLYCSSRDISKRKATENALRQSEDRYRTAFHTSLDSVNINRLTDGTYIDVNPAFLNITGYRRSEVIGRTSLDLKIWNDPADRERMVSLLQREGKCSNLEAQFRIKDGSTIWGLMSAASIELNGETCILSVTRDISQRKQMEQELRDREIRHELALRATNDVIWDWDVVKDLQEWNDAGAHIFGWTDVVAHPQAANWWLDRLHPEDRQRVADGFSQVVNNSTESFWRDEYRFRCADGRFVEVMDRGYIQRDESGHPIRMVGAMQDISAQKAAAAELDQYRHHLEELVEQRTEALQQTEAKARDLLTSSADGLYGVDQLGVITFINPSACSMLGYREEEVIGKSAHAIFHHSKPDGSPYPIEDCPSHNAVQKGYQLRIDNEVYWRSNGQALPVMYAVHPTFHDGVNTGAVISVVDMSEQRAAADAREKALVAAEHLARVRSDFLSNMSHEIRTPLNGVLGFAQIGYRNFDNAEKAKTAFEKIITSGNLLLGVVNDILDFSKIEAGKFQLELKEVSLRDVVDHTVDLIRDRAIAKGLSINIERSPDFPAYCRSDQLRLSQVLLNLLSNAVKFTETGSVKLALSCQRGMLVFNVTDTGIGINGEQIGLLFNPFHQADTSTTRKYGGSGLGLAITKRILELMGGCIDVASQPGVGSTFVFQIPYVQSEEPKKGVSLGNAPTPSSLDGIKILVAEDDPINQLVINENLTEEGATVTLVGSGTEAVDLVTREGAETFDIVLMDIQMPEMDGYEATRRILSVAPDLSIIGQTAHASEADRDKCLAAGMVAHIAKPIDPTALVGLILRYSKKRA